MKELGKRKKQAMETRKAIFSNAVRLFVQDSYERVTIGDICRAANVSIGAFYHHFKNKESILNEGYRLFDLKVEEKWNEGHPAERTAVMHWLVDAQMRSMEEIGPLASAQYFKNQLTNEVKYILNEDRFFYGTLQSAVREAVDARDLYGDVRTIVGDILSTGRGIIYDWCLHDGSYSLTERGRRILDMVLLYYRQR